jgi:hypothetical protein
MPASGPGPVGSSAPVSASSTWAPPAAAGEMGDVFIIILKNAFKNVQFLLSFYFQAEM